MLLSDAMPSSALEELLADEKVPLDVYGFTRKMNTCRLYVHFCHYFQKANSL